MSEQGALAAELIEHAAALTAEQLATCCQAEVAWIAELVQEGILVVEGEDPAAWRFDSSALARALKARRLQRDFGANLEALGLILDLMEQVERLRSALRRA